VTVFPRIASLPTPREAWYSTTVIPTADAGYALFPVPADQGIRAWGRDLPEVFRQAALGLTSLLVDPATLRPDREIPVAVEAGDREALLVAWLNELLYLCDAQGVVVVDCAVRSLTETALSAVVCAAELDPSRQVVVGHVKAVTYHLLRVAPSERGWEATVVVDV
jgi:SHS2 domain-containing protein